jgi:ribonuclease E
MLEPDNSDNTATTTPESAESPTAAPRKRVAKKAPAARAQAAKTSPDPSSAPVVNPDQPAPSDQPDQTADSPVIPRKRARKSSAKAAAPALFEPAAVTDGPAEEAGADSPPVKPARAPRKRPAKKAAATAADIGTADEPSDSPADSAATPAATAVLFQPPSEAPAPRRRRAAKAVAGPPAERADAGTESDADTDEATEPSPADADLTIAAAAEDATAEPEDVREAAVEEATGARRRRRRGRRGRGGGGTRAADGTDEDDNDRPADAEAGNEADDESDESDTETADGGATKRRRRRRRSSGGGGNGEAGSEDDPPNTVVHVRTPRDTDDDGVRGVKGSTRLEAKRQRRRDGRESGRRRPPILTEAEFLARREAVDRVMAVRQRGDRTQIAVLEDGVLVEHYVTRASATSYVGNIYLGRVQNVLPSMEAAFVDIGKGRNGVLYAGEVNWDAAGLEGKSRAIEHALKSGDVVLVQVTKDPIGHKGARLTSQISLPGRFLVYVPNGGMTGISRKLPDVERHRLKSILKKIVPEDAGVIIRTAAEGASEEDLTHDVQRLTAQWDAISKKAQKTSAAPTLVHGEPDLAIRVVRDVFNEDFKRLVVEGDEAWKTVTDYVEGVAPDLGERVSRHTAESDLFHDLRVDEQLMKALDRKVWLPSGGSLVIDRTEAMTVVDVNTGKFIGSGGNLEQTVTRNNLEAAEEIVRQLRLRDVGGIVVIDFIDMVLESNRDLVLRRLTECLGRDRTKHQVAEVTSLGLVQMTRKRVGEGLLEAFSEPCEVCKGRGVILHTEPVDRTPAGGGSEPAEEDRPKSGRRRRGAKRPEPVELDPGMSPEQRQKALAAMAAIHRAAHPDDEDYDEAAHGVAADDAESDGGAESDDADLEVAPIEVADIVALLDAQPADPDAVEVVAADVDAADVEVADVEVAEVEVADAEPAPASPVKAAPKRRRRAASRPAGPPAGVGV